MGHVESLLMKKNYTFTGIHIHPAISKHMMKGYMNEVPIPSNVSKEEKKRKSIKKT